MHHGLNRRSTFPLLDGGRVGDYYSFAYITLGYSVVAQWLAVDSGPGTATISPLSKLQFLRYSAGQSLFQRIFYYTLQLYLNDDSAILKGDATRFWLNPRLRKSSKVGESVCVDVEPRMDRVLIFELGDLIYTKYNIRADVREPTATCCHQHFVEHGIHKYRRYVEFFILANYHFQSFCFFGRLGRG
jgi:hypothetical protein